MSQPSQPGCLFSAPPVRRSYCQPAPLSRADGGRYHRITQAYGASRPL